MTARSKNPASMLLSSKRADTTPKERRKIRGTNSGRGTEVARSRGKSTASAASAELIDPAKPLTDKQKLFVQFWAKGESITSASVRAGYNDGASLAYRMVRMPNVLRLYEAEKQKYESAAQMTRQKVMDGLLEAVEMAKLLSEPATMVQGWKTIGQMCGYFAPVEHKVKVDVTGNIVVDKLNNMSDAELLRVITAGAAEAISDDQ